MSVGRGRRIALASAVALACPLAPAATEMASGAPTAHAAKSKFVFLKARVVSDGYVTPGEAETISVSRLGPKAAVDVSIEAPPTTIQCGELYFCDPAPAGPAPGSPPFRSDKKGRATLTFITPETYDIETDPFNPKIRQPVRFADQQRVHIDVEAISKTKRVKRASFGFARVIVQLAK